MEVLIGLLAIIGLAVFVTIYSTKKKREHLLAKYGDPEIVEKIMQRKIWQDMTEEQLRDSWGSPVDIDEKVFKTKTTEVFKYNRIGKNRFGSRVRVENGFVVGWDLK